MPAMELTAEPSWQAVDLISDLHLRAEDTETFAVWQGYMRTTAADALFILGDLFEVWVGDDVLQQEAFEQDCAVVIRELSGRTPVFFMHGNRDFLVGQAFLTACGATWLADPTILIFQQQRWLLAHGDALCSDDTDYLVFRHQVRGSQWQQTFLAKPLADRKLIARSLRQQSQTQHDVRKKAGIADAEVNAIAASELLKHTNAKTLIHGHTHKPAEHSLGNGLQRVVLSDWDATASPKRAQVLRLSSTGLQRIEATDRSCAG